MDTSTSGFNPANVAITGGTVTGTNAPYALVRSAIPFIQISTGSIGNNGALTGVTALGRVYSNGAYCYYPASAISAGSTAGWYWTVFSSTSAGTIYNSTYTSGIPTIGVQTAFATTGPGAFTGDTTEQVGPTVTLAAGALGANGALEFWGLFEATNSAGAKTPRVKYGGTTFSSLTALTTNVTDIYSGMIYNRGVAGAQIGNFDAVRGNNSALGASSVTGTVDSTAAQACAISLQKATATDNIVLEAYEWKVVFGA